MTKDVRPLYSKWKGLQNRICSTTHFCIVNDPHAYEKLENMPIVKGRLLRFFNFLIYEPYNKPFSHENPNKSYIKDSGLACGGAVDRASTWTLKSRIQNPGLCPVRAHRTSYQWTTKVKPPRVDTSHSPHESEGGAERQCPAQQVSSPEGRSQPHSRDPQSTSDFWFFCYLPLDISRLH